MLETTRSLLERAWPLLGSLYLLYLALQGPPMRYVGIGGLVVVTPLLVGWVAGLVLGVGPWADDETDADPAGDVDDEDLEGVEE